MQWRIIRLKMGHRYKNNSYVVFFWINYAILIDIKNRVAQVYIEYTVGDHTINYTKYINLSNQ